MFKSVFGCRLSGALTLFALVLGLCCPGLIAQAGSEVGTRAAATPQIVGYDTPPASEPVPYGAGVKADGDLVPGVPAGVALRAVQSGSMFDAGLTGWPLKELPEWTRLLLIFLAVCCVLIVGGLVVIAVVVIGFVLAVRAALALNRALRPRCRECGGGMRKASSREHAEILRRGQRLEQEGGSAIYTTWVCKSCGHQQAERFKKFFAPLKTCPKCDFVTLHVVETVLNSATQRGSGRAERVSDCVNCGYHDIAEIILPARGDGQAGDPER